MPNLLLLKGMALTLLHVRNSCQAHAELMNSSFMLQRWTNKKNERGPHLNAQGSLSGSPHHSLLDGPPSQLIALA